MFSTEAARHHQEPLLSTNRNGVPAGTDGKAGTRRPLGALVWHRLFAQAASESDKLGNLPAISLYELDLYSVHVSLPELCALMRSSVRCLKLIRRHSEKAVSR